MPGGSPRGEPLAAVWSELEAWLGASDEGRCLLARFREDPDGQAGALAAWVRAHGAAAPGSIATYVNGRVDELVNVARVHQLNISGQVVNVHIYPSSTVPGAAPRPVRREERAPFEPESVPVPAGPFLMGSGDGAGVQDHEKPAYDVTLPPFRIGRYPVTNGQYLEFVRRTRAAVRGEMGWDIVALGQVPPSGRYDHPAAGMSWDDALAYCRWLSQATGRVYRLPSEAEWEKAARGTDGRRYPWGDAFAVGRCNSLEQGVGATTPVGAFAGSGDSPYGCAEMAGNVWEWTSTIWGIERAHPRFGPPYRDDDGRDLPEPSSPYRELRICRGGSFGERAERVTCTARGRQPADARDARRGFRVVLAED